MIEPLRLYDHNVGMQRLSWTDGCRGGTGEGTQVDEGTQKENAELQKEEAECLQREEELKELQMEILKE